MTTKRLKELLELRAAVQRGRDNIASLSCKLNKFEVNPITGFSVLVEFRTADGSRREFTQRLADKEDIEQLYICFEEILTKRMVAVNDELTAHGIEFED